MTTEGLRKFCQTVKNDVAEIRELLFGKIARGYLTIAGVVVANETILVNGVTWTAKVTPVGVTEFLLGATKAANAVNLAAALNASANAAINIAIYTASGETVLIKVRAKGTAGNAFTLANSSGAHITRSGATLTGGTDAFVAGISQAAADLRYLLISNAIRNYRGAYNASVNTFPATGGSGAAGAVLKGDAWRISVTGVLGVITVAINTEIYALVDTPGQTPANWFIPAGTYTPTLTNQANVANSTAYICQFSRTANAVTVSGKVDIEPTLATQITRLDMTLPVASNLSSAIQCAGSALYSGAVPEIANVVGNSVSDLARIQWTTVAGSGAQLGWYFIYQYQVI